MHYSKSTLMKCNGEKNTVYQTNTIAYVHQGKEHNYGNYK